MSKSLSLHTLVDRLAVGIYVLYAKLHGTSRRDGVWKLPGKVGDNFVNGTEANVTDLSQNLTTEIGAGALTMRLGESRNNLSAGSSTPRDIPCLLLIVLKKIKSITLALSSQAGEKSILR